MKNLHHIYLGMLFTLAAPLFLLASIAAAANADLAVTETASTSNAKVGSLVTFNGTLTNKGPDPVGGSGFVSIYVDGLDGLSIQSVNCHGPSPDGPFCEYSTPFAVGQSEHMSVVTKVVGGAAGQFAWLVFCSYNGNGVNDPVGGNDCALKAIRVP